MKPLVSIVTPSFNQAPFLERCILSIQSQTYSRIEHIVMDGGSSDGSLDVLRKHERSYKLRWVSQKDHGQSHAINLGFRKAEGDFVFWLNSDDVLTRRDSVELIVRRFMERPQVDVIFADRIVIDGDDRLRKFQYTGPYDRLLVRDGVRPIFQENVFFRKKVIKELEIDETLHVVMDTDYWIRLGERFSFEYMPGIFAAFRVHGTNKTMSEDLVARWNTEKEYLRERYGAKRFRVGVGAQPRRYLHRLRCLLSGSYNNYLRLPADLKEVRSKDSAYFEFKAEQSLMQYTLASLTPYRG